MAKLLKSLSLSGLYGATIEEVAERLIAERLQQLVAKRRHLSLPNPYRPRRTDG
jgi:hypothetical protein